MSPSSRLSVSPISIGDCKVEFLGNNISYELSPNNLFISALNAAKIKISQVDNPTKCAAEKLCSNCSSKLIHEDGVEGEGDSPLGNFSFLLLNPKDIDSRSKSLLQDVLNLYMKELPSMNYAANTGKKSRFLERCVSSGKYRTLLLETGGKEPREVVAAISYQIIPANTLYAEIPVAAVSSSYQDKGIGHLLYMELRRRLQDVGVLTLFCWGDKESEGFWIKQGFISVAEVDTKGRARKLPIKADIRRALCIPGGSTLMVSHLNKDLTVPANPPRTVKLCFPVKPHAKMPSQVSVGAPLLLKTTKLEVSTESGKEPNPIVDQIENSDPQASRKDGNLEDEQKIHGLSLPFRIWGCKDMVPQNDVDGNNAATDTVVVEYGCDAVGRFCMCSGQHVKRRIWESSCSSLKSKKVKGGHQIDCYLHSSWDLTKKEGSQYLDSCGGFSLDLVMNKSLVDVTPADFPHLSCQAVPSEKNAEAQITPVEDHVSGGLPSNVEHPVIMLMNIADDTKKACLTKIVEELGGGVTSSGGTSTHVITGKARRTLNFCTALCSGAWIVSPNWLKASFREGHFVDELPHILDDEDYKVRYRTELKDAVLKAKASPCALLLGYDVCLARHVQPAVDILSEIIKSAGGNSAVDSIVRYGSVDKMLSFLSQLWSF